MHFGLGMACGGAATLALCGIQALRGKRPPLRWATPVMTACGIWGVGPDLTRLLREDFPSLGLASTLGSKALERWMMNFGDLFFFHRTLDSQPRELALHGLILIIVCYNIGWLLARFDRAAPTVALRGTHVQPRRPRTEAPPRPSDAAASDSAPARRRAA